MREQKSDVAAFAGDLSDWVAARDTMAIAVDRFGGLDILVKTQEGPSTS